MDAVLSVSRKLLLAHQEVTQQQHASVLDPINGPHAVAATSGGGIDASGTTHASGVVGLFVNGCLLSAVTAFALAQISKVFTHYYVEKTWDWTRLVGSGGMPSSHTAFVVGLTTAVGVKDGTSSSLFALCLVMTLIVMYDATGVRLHAGKQATVLNLIIAELPPGHPVQDTARLRDTLGHTPIQVLVGAVLGIVVGYLVQLQFVGAALNSGSPVPPTH